MARRLTAKRDDGGEAEKSSGAAAGDFTYVRKDSTQDASSGTAKEAVRGGVTIGADEELGSEEIAWSMPSRCLVSHGRQGGARAFLGNMLGTAHSEAQLVGQNNSINALQQRSINRKKRILDANGGDYVGRVAITVS